MTIDFETPDAARTPGGLSRQSRRSWYLEVDGRRIELRDGEVTLGRSRGCGVVLKDPSVSRGHALLSVRSDRVTLQDLRSSNGTYVNGKRLESEIDLAEGDRLTLGETQAFLRRTTGAGAPERLRRPPGEAALFCPSCGTPVAEPAASCPACGGALAGVRLPRRSEALAMGEVLPVGEVLGSSSGSWDATEPRRAFRRLTPPPDDGPPPAAPAGADLEPSPPPAGAASALQPSYTQVGRVIAPPPGPLARLAAGLRRLLGR